jgi:broad specificity phosphatase PhoE
MNASKMEAHVSGTKALPSHRGADFFFVRHGERDDHVKMEQNTFRDTPTLEQQSSNYHSYGEEKNTTLTDTGRVQGYKTGAFLAEKIQPGRRVLVLSSPYVRCMDTAQMLCDGLRQTNPNIKIHKDTIFLTSYLKEVQRTTTKLTFNT